MRTPFSEERKRKRVCILNEQLGTRMVQAPAMRSQSTSAEDDCVGDVDTQCIPIERTGTWQPHAECRSRASAQDDGVGYVDTYAYSHRTHRRVVAARRVQISSISAR